MPTKSRLIQLGEGEVVRRGNAASNRISPLEWVGLVSSWSAVSVWFAMHVSAPATRTIPIASKSSEEDVSATSPEL